MNMWRLSSALLIPLCSSFGGLGGAMPRVFRSSIDNMLLPGKSVQITSQISISRQLWLKQHFELRGSSGIVIHSKHRFALHDVAIPHAIRDSHTHRQIFLDKATGIPGQIPTRTSGPFSDTWDVIEIQAEKMITGAANNNLARRFRTIDLTKRKLVVVHDGDDVLFRLEPLGLGENTYFGTAALTLSLSQMTGMSTLDAHDIIINEAMMWVFVDPPNELSPVGMQLWNSGRWYGVDLLHQILDHESIKGTLDQQGDSLNVFLDYLSASGVDFSGTFSGLPVDLFFFGAQYVAGEMEGLYQVVAHSPSEILEWVSSANSTPAQFVGDWYDYEPDSIPFIDSVLPSNPLIETGGSFDAMYRSHSVRSEGKYRVNILANLQSSIQVPTTTDVDVVLRKAGGGYHETRTGNRSIFNDLDPGFYYLEISQLQAGDSVFGECQIFEGCLLNLEGVGVQTVINFDHGSLVQTYGILDRNHRRNMYILELDAGDVISIGAQPFLPPIGATDYHVTIEFDRVLWPLWDNPIVEVPNIDQAPETVLQTYRVMQDGTFSVGVITEHSLKDTDYCITFLRGGAIDVDTQSEALSVVGRVE